LEKGERAEMSVAAVVLVVALVLRHALHPF
jgi:hypothetical protein